ncbi:hypothetical protein RHODO2019_11080 [Rhodococcus antarcticus]|uniref:Transposase n=1 Tax=Rhodococcus antarcticus TaxID=2987751 RepID=A0ABY6NWY6_9NOCA|nr:hypothetical protein [Rhodococcus antarcticus]UZJ23749.1 hypothetical protein RHODO2019_11080 [Rhodococcus antarcticus]
MGYFSQDRIDQRNARKGDPPPVAPEPQQPWGKSVVGGKASLVWERKLMEEQVVLQRETNRLLHEISAKLDRTT